MPSLPEGFTARPVTPADAPAVNELVIAVDEDVQGWSDSTEGDLVDWWRDVDLEHDSWFVTDAGGELGAYSMLYVHGETADLDGYVRPTLRGRGLGTWLLETGEARARAKELPKAHTWALTPDAGARELFELRGFREVRRYYRMLIELDGEPAEPEWPAGMTIDTFTLDDAREFYDALNDAFAEEWNWAPLPFDLWLERRVHAPEADHSLWWMLRDGSEIAGLLRADPSRFDAGWVGNVGVRKPWRRRGLGLALLQHAFREFHRRGQNRVALGVDAQNPTGATRLYERAGMHVAYEAVAYEKSLA